MMPLSGTLLPLCGLEDNTANSLYGQKQGFGLILITRNFVTFIIYFYYYFYSIYIVHDRGLVDVGSLQMLF